MTQQTEAKDDSRPEMVLKHARKRKKKKTKRRKRGRGRETRGGDERRESAHMREGILIDIICKDVNSSARAHLLLTTFFVHQLHKLIAHVVLLLRKTKKRKAKTNCLVRTKQVKKKTKSKSGLLWSVGTAAAPPPPPPPPHTHTHTHTCFLGSPGCSNSKERDTFSCATFCSEAIMLRTCGGGQCVNASNQNHKKTRKKETNNSDKKQMQQVKKNS